MRRASILLAIMVTVMSVIRFTPAVASTLPEEGDTVAQADCPVDNFLDISTFQQAGLPTPELNVYCDDETIIVEANGIPNFEYTQVTPNGLAEQNYRWQIPLEPTEAVETSQIPLTGPVAIAVNGLPIFGPNEAPFDDYGDPLLDQLLDYCNGHTAPGGIYHFHARPDCLFETVEGEVGLVIGYAFDGYPILAPYLCEDTSCSSVVEAVSSWQHNSDVRNAWQANEYVAGSGNLDRCNGTYLADGSYAYFATDTFPYFLGCYHGIAIANGPSGNDQSLAGNAPQGGGGRPPRR
jgi:hypothetical protein